MPDFKNVTKDLLKLAGEVIDADHDHLAKARIVYLERGGDWTANGEDVLGTIKVATGMDRVLIGKDKFGHVDLIVTVNELHWADWKERADEVKPKALLDELFCSISGTKIDGFKKNPADFLGYHDNVRRFGAWRPQLQRGQKAFEQMELPSASTG